MAGEFIARRGLISQGDTQITGSLNISQNIVAVGTVQASFDASTGTAISGAFDSVSASLASDISLNASSITSLNAASSSYLLNTSDTLTGTLHVDGNVGIGTTNITGLFTVKPVGNFTTGSNDGNFDGYGLFIDNTRFGTGGPKTLGGIGFSTGANPNRKVAAIMSVNDSADADLVGLGFYANPQSAGSSGFLREAMRIASSGNITIGGSVSSAKLHVIQPTGGLDSLWVENSETNNVVRFKAGASYKNFLDFYTDSSLGDVVIRSGNIGIGITSPDTKLHVNGITLSQGLYIPGLVTLPNVQGAIQADIPSTSYNAFRLRDTATGSSHTIHGFASNWSGGVSPGHLNLEGITAVSFGTWVGPNMIIHHATGNVGIGIGDSTPDGRLTISAGSENQTAPVNAIRIKGPNAPGDENSSQNISWDFNFAGSAKIRASRGPSWGTKIEFLTNTSSQGSDNPGVKLSILDNGGITFNGDTAAANALDDYEEGTWTPTILFGGGSVGVTYNTTFTKGLYTKVGRQVTLTGIMVLSNKGTSTGSARIANFPFTANADYGAASGLAMSVQKISYTGQIQGRIFGGNSSAGIEQITEAGTYSELTDTNFQNTSEINFSVTYFV